MGVYSSPQPWFPDPADLWLCYRIVTSNHLSQRELKSGAFLSPPPEASPQADAVWIYAARASASTSSQDFEINTRDVLMLPPPTPLLAFFSLSLSEVQVSVACLWGVALCWVFDD